MLCPGTANLVTKVEMNCFAAFTASLDFKGATSSYLVDLSIMVSRYLGPLLGDVPVVSRWAVLKCLNSTGMLCTGLEADM